MTDFPAKLRTVLPDLRLSPIMVGSPSDWCSAFWPWRGRTRATGGFRALSHTIQSSRETCLIDAAASPGTFLPEGANGRNDGKERAMTIDRIHTSHSGSLP